MRLDKKRCRVCGELKPRPAFARERKAADGLQGACRACDSARARAATAANPGRGGAAGRAWRAANLARVQAAARARYEAHRDDVLARNHAWNTTHRDRTAESTRAWRAANLERVRAMGAARRARELDAWVEDVDRDVLWARDGGCCRLCGLPADRAAWHLEHLTPLSRGGEHSYANTAVAHPVCNQEKGMLTLMEFYARVGGGHG